MNIYSYVSILKTTHTVVHTVYIHQFTGLTFSFGFGLGATDGFKLVEFSAGATLVAETAFLMLGPLLGAGGGRTASEVDFCF